MAQPKHYDVHQNPKKASSSLPNRDDFDGGPVSVDQIEKGLYLGTLNRLMSHRAFFFF